MAATAKQAAQKQQEQRVLQSRASELGGVVAERNFKQILGKLTELKNVQEIMQR